MIGRLKPPAWARTAVATCPLLQLVVADGMHGYRDSQQVLVSIRSATVVGEAAEVDKNKREWDSEDSRSWTRNRLLYLGRLFRVRYRLMALGRRDSRPKIWAAAPWRLCDQRSTVLDSIG